MSNELKKRIIDAGLCTGCGICYAVCPETVIEIDAFKNKGEPMFNDKCIQCNLCLQCCPGEDSFWSDNFKSDDSYLKKECYYMGPVKKIYLSHSADVEERNRGASGGSVSAICRFLLDSGIVDTVIGVGFITPLEPKPLIIKNSKDILKISQSKYVRVPNCKIFREDKLGNSICFIGLPCHLKAIKKTRLYCKITDKIRILIGLYCGNGLYFDATIELLKKMGCRDHNEIESIYYRDGEWPGNFTVKKKNGEKKAISKMTFNYLSYFYTPKRCYLCNELSSFDADISFADGWIKYNRRTNKGWNLLITRTDFGTEIVNMAAKSGYLVKEEIEENKAINMHRHNMYNKHYLANLRCKVLSTFKIETPHYINFKGNVKEYLLAVITLIIFSIGNWKISRFIAGYIPFSIYRDLMAFSRKRWRDIS
jgi:coenzyme F420 hydrogenase subunit beta